MRRAFRFDPLALVRLAALGLAISLWYLVILPTAMLFDAAVPGADRLEVTLGHYFDGI